MRYFSHDDIVQISSAPGRGAVGIIRLSGLNAFAIVERLLADAESPVGTGRGVLDRRLAIPFRVYSGGGARATRAVPCPARLFFMPAPASYTREDVVEIHLPGSPAVLRAAMRAFVAAGARAAEPGEFTFRAFRNGRLTLAQAEAVEATIKAADADAAGAALARLGDPTPKRLVAWRDRLLGVAAGLEAALDFDGEELGDDPVLGLAGLVAELTDAGVELAARDKPTLDPLPHAALVGLTNAGKSSLFNALLGKDEAIVSGELSTTRDNLRCEADWEGGRLVLSDNPGLDAAAAGAAGAAVDLAFERIGGEDVAVWVIDASREWDGELSRFAARLRGRVIVALSKADLPAGVSTDTVMANVAAAGLRPVAVASVSAGSGAGVADLRSVIGRACRDAVPRTGWNRREEHELADALGHCRAALVELEGAGRLELASEDVRAALASFSRALGDGYAEEALGLIFSRFCLGK